MEVRDLDHVPAPGLDLFGQPDHLVDRLLAVEFHDVFLDDLMQFIKGPDFPTGGMILGAEALRNALKTSGMTPLSALSMMVFVLLYLPCLASIAAIRRETGSYKWMSFSIAYSTTVAWIMSFIVYQGGKLLGYA